MCEVSMKDYEELCTQIASQVLLSYFPHIGTKP